MKLITNRKISEIKTTYTDESYVSDKYMYCKTTSNDYEIYHIFKVTNILSIYPLKYNVTRYYYLCVPKNKKIKAYLYDKKSYVDIGYKVQLFELTFDEYLNTYRSFIDCDGKYPTELPTKIIKDFQ